MRGIIVTFYNKCYNNLVCLNSGKRIGLFGRSLGVGGNLDN